MKENKKMANLNEISTEQKEQGEIAPFTLSADANAESAPASFEDDDIQQAESDTAEAALSLLNNEDTADKKKAEHEAAEAKRKAEWEAKRAEKKAAAEKALQELFAMSDDDVAWASVKKTGDDLERLTRRNMKMCVTEVIQTKCLEDPAFARFVCHPQKNLINCFKYLNKKAEEYVRAELEMRGEKASGVIGEDIPDDLCYKWAEDYYRDMDAEIDRDKDDKFVPKPYSGGGSSSKSKKKEPPKSKAKPEPTPAPDVEKTESDGSQMNLFGMGDAGGAEECA
jgi:hypothetical protein